VIHFVWVILLAVAAVIALWTEPSDE